MIKDPESYTQYIDSSLTEFGVGQIKFGKVIHMVNEDSLENYFTIIANMDTSDNRSTINKEKINSLKEASHLIAKRTIIELVEPDDFDFVRVQVVYPKGYKTRIGNISLGIEPMNFDFLIDTLNK